MTSTLGFWKQNIFHFNNLRYMDLKSFNTDNFDCVINFDRVIFHSMLMVDMQKVASI